MEASNKYSLVPDPGHSLIPNPGVGSKNAQDPNQRTFFVSTPQQFSSMNPQFVSNTPFRRNWYCTGHRVDALTFATFDQQTYLDV